jgi:hypothetical protein
VDQPRIVHEQRENLVVLVLVGERAVLVESPQRLRPAQRIRNQKRQLDHRRPREAIALGAAQPERNVDLAVLHVLGLLGDFADRRGAVEQFDFTCRWSLASSSFAQGSTTST